MCLKIDAQRKKLKRARNIIACRSKFPLKKVVESYLVEHLPKQTISFILFQIEIHKKKKKGRRYNAEIKSLALCIFYISGSAYSIIAKLFDLPSKPTLVRWLHGIEVHPGINQQMLAALKLKVYKMDKNARKCILCMDEMSLKSNVFYDTKSDKFGLEDTGTERNSLLATSALVVMARGVFSKRKQPIAFYFVNNTCNSLTLQGIIASVTRTHRKNWIKCARNCIRYEI